MKKTASYKDYIQNEEGITHLYLYDKDNIAPEKLTQLKGLIINHTKHTELPKWIQSLTNLEELDISYSKITSLPDWLPQLKNLKVLRFNYCDLQEMPLIINEMKQLEELSLEYSLEKLPNQLELPELKSLNLVGSEYLEDQLFLDSLIRLPRLEVLNIDTSMYDFEKFFTTLCKKRFALVNKSNIPPEALTALCLIFLKKFDALQKIDRPLIYTLLNTGSALYRKITLEYLTSQQSNLPQTLFQKQVFILGKLTVKKEDYANWLEDTGAILDKKISPSTDYIILGEKPGKKLEQVFPYEKKVILEQAVWNLKKTPYLANEAPEITQNLKELLQNPVVENLEIALQIMETGGMPSHLIEEIVGIMLFHKNNKTRKKAQLIFDRFSTQKLSVKAQNLLKENIYRIKDDKKVTQYLRNLALATNWDIDILAHATYRASNKEQAQGLCLMSPKVSIHVIRDYINYYNQIEFKPHTGLANGLYLEHIPPAVEEISKEIEEIYLKDFKFKDEDYLKLNGFKRLHLDFGHNRKIPDSIFSNTQVEQLNLTAYRVKTISPLIGKLIRLKKLNLSLLHATTLPKEFGNLQELKQLTLALSIDKAIEIPLCISQLSALEYWYMSYPVNNFPKAFEQLTFLKKLIIEVSDTCSTEDKSRLEKLRKKLNE